MSGQVSCGLGLAGEHLSGNEWMGPGGERGPRGVAAHIYGSVVALFRDQKRKSHLDDLSVQEVKCCVVELLLLSSHMLFA